MSDLFVITGATSPLGKVIVKKILKRGDKCVLIVRNKSQIKDIINTKKENCEVIEANLSDSDEIKKTLDAIDGIEEKISSFIHLAAANLKDDFELDLIETVFRVNVFSGWVLARACLTKMLENKYGRIVFCGSIGHKFGGKSGRLSYSASKYLMQYYPREFKECAEYNVLVNTIQLGVMRNGTQDKLGLNEAEIEKRISMIPTKRAITHDEAANNILYLCSKDNMSIHNHVLSCAGGE